MFEKKYIQIGKEKGTSEVKYVEVNPKKAVLTGEELEKQQSETGKKINDPTSGMRMLNRKMLCDYAFNMNRNPEPDTLVFQIEKGAVIKEIQVSMNERTTGVSLYSGMAASAKYMVRMVLSILFFS